MVVATIAIIVCGTSPSSSTHRQTTLQDTLRSYSFQFTHWHFHLCQILLPLPSKQVLEFCWLDKSATDTVVSTIEQVKTISKQYRKHRRMNLCVACAVLREQLSAVVSLLLCWHIAEPFPITVHLLCTCLHCTQIVAVCQLWKTACCEVKRMRSVNSSANYSPSIQRSSGE